MRFNKIISIFLFMLILSLLSGCFKQTEPKTVYIDLLDPFTGEYVCNITNRKINWQWNYDKLPSLQKPVLRFKSDGSYIDVPKYNGTDFKNMLNFTGEDKYPNEIGEHLLVFEVLTGEGIFKNKSYKGSTLAVSITIIGQARLGIGITSVTDVPSDSTFVSTKKQYKFVAPENGEYTITTNTDAIDQVITAYLTIEGATIISQSDDKFNTTKVLLAANQEITIITGHTQFNTDTAYDLDIEFTPNEL